VTAAMTPFVPGAGPPPTIIPTRLIAIGTNACSAFCFLKAFAKLAHTHVGGFGEGLDPSVIYEVAGLESRHVGSRHAISFARDVNISYSCLPCLRVANILKGEWNEPATLDADHRAAAATQQKSDRAVSEITAIRGVKRNRIRTAQLVPYVFARDC